MKINSRSQAKGESGLRHSLTHFLNGVVIGTSLMIFHQFQFERIVWIYVLYFQYYIVQFKCETFIAATFITVTIVFGLNQTKTVSDPDHLFIIVKCTKIEMGRDSERKLFICSIVGFQNFRSFFYPAGGVQGLYFVSPGSLKRCGLSTAFRRSY